MNKNYLKIIPLSISIMTASSGEEGGEDGESGEGEGEGEGEGKGEGEGGGVGVTMKKGERLDGGDSFGSDK